MGDSCATHAHAQTHARELGPPRAERHILLIRFQYHTSEDYVMLISLTRTSGLGAIALHNLQCSSGYLMHLLRLLFEL